MNADLIGGVLGSAIGVLVIAGSLALGIGTPASPQPGSFPFVGGVALVGLSLGLLARSSRRPGEVKETSDGWRRPVIVVAAMAVHAALLERVGYVVGTLFVVGVIMRALGVTSWRILTVSSIILSLGTFVLFARILGVELPAGMLELFG